jgi:hypothetical protein
MFGEYPTTKLSRKAKTRKAITVENPPTKSGAKFATYTKRTYWAIPRSSCL